MIQTDTFLHVKLAGILITVLLLTGCWSQQSETEIAFDKAVRALANDNIDELKTIVKNTPSILSWHDDNKLGIIHYAITYEQDSLISTFNQFTDQIKIDEQQSTLLNFASMSGNTDYVKWLLSTNADINAKHNDDKITPIIYASMFCHEEIVHLLVDRGADLQSLDRFGYSALDYALLLNHSEISAALQRKGAKSTVPISLR